MNDQIMKNDTRLSDLRKGDSMLMNEMTMNESMLMNE